MCILLNTFERDGCYTALKLHDALGARRDVGKSYKLNINAYFCMDYILQRYEIYTYNDISIQRIRCSSSYWNFFFVFCAHNILLGKSIVSSRLPFFPAHFLLFVLYRFEEFPDFLGENGNTVRSN